MSAWQRPVPDTIEHYRWDTSRNFQPRRRNDWGQRPSVIIRGNKPGKKQGIDTVYLLHFGRIVVSGGGFQYQQLVNSDQWPGFYDFNWITSEVRLR